MEIDKVAKYLLLDNEIIKINEIYELCISNFTVNYDGIGLRNSCNVTLELTMDPNTAVHLFHNSSKICMVEKDNEKNLLE